MSAALVWQVIKKDNAFVRRGLNGAIFSAEKGNVYNRHSYSQSGKRMRARERVWGGEPPRAVHTSTCEREHAPCTQSMRAGLVNAKSIDVSVDAKTDAVTVGYGSAKNANKPKKAVTTFAVKSNARRALKALGKQAGSYRPDLKARRGRAGRAEESGESLESAQQQRAAVGRGDEAAAGEPLRVAAGGGRAAVAAWRPRRRAWRCCSDVKGGWAARRRRGAARRAGRCRAGHRGQQVPSSTKDGAWDGSAATVTSRPPAAGVWAGGGVPRRRRCGRSGQCV